MFRPSNPRPSSSVAMPRDFLVPSAQLTWRDGVLAGAVFLLALALFWYSPITQMGDSKYTLLLTQSLLSRGSFALEAYSIPRQTPRDIGGISVDGDIYQMEVVGGHLYYLFPPGSSILSAPFVLAGDCLGESVAGADRVYDAGREEAVQHGIASLLMAGLAAVFYFTGRLLLPTGWSAGLALGGALGTQVWSTASRALWAHTWGIALLGYAVYLLLAHAEGRRRLPPVLLATVLSWTYFVRPTNSVFILGVTGYVLLCRRALFWRYAATGAAWFAGFVLYSWSLYGKALPGYYQASRLRTGHFWGALAGNLVSPSRGLLVYVPVTLWVAYLLARHWRRLPHRPLAWLALAVTAGHLAAVSCFPHWFGGSCYGPRFTTELVPWLALLAALGLRAARDRRAEDGGVRPRAWEWPATWAAGAFLLLLSVGINARGANVLATATWNNLPVTVDQDSPRVWDWRCPQCLAGLVCRPLPAVFPRLDGQRQRFGSEEGRAFQLDGWSESEAGFCWSEGGEAALVFGTDDLTATRLLVFFGAYIAGDNPRRQRVSVRLNGQQIAALTARQPEPREYVFTLPRGLLRRENVLTFKLPDAAAPADGGTGNSDLRRLGLALYWMELRGANPPNLSPAPPPPP